MRKALLILLLLVAGVTAAFWLQDLGGQVEVRVGDTIVVTSFAVALLLLILAFAAMHLLLLASGWVWNLRRRRRLRRLMRSRTTGDAAVNRALISLAAGNGDAARMDVRRARLALGDTPQTLLLAAEAERLAGRPHAAEAAFLTLAQREDARFLGLRGLLRAAMERGDWEAARTLAREAEAAQPGATWLREERARLALRTRNWEEALALAPPDAPRAALALAAASQDGIGEGAADLERQAFEADPGFTPAALAHARRLLATGSPRKARSVIEDAWARAPHPDLAAPYLGEEQDPLMRVKAAETLVRRNPSHPESRLLLARIALEGGLTGRARNALDSLVRDGKADRRAYLMLAELEEAEHGETVEARLAQARWLRAAAAATSEPSWRCGHCGASHPEWVPVCRRCETVGQIAWTGFEAAGRATASGPNAAAG
jgi:HemY protein